MPAIIQDARTRQVLMLGFMNQAAWDQTRATGLRWGYPPHSGASHRPRLPHRSSYLLEYV
jgi:hypothetical protein